MLGDGLSVRPASPTFLVREKSQAGGAMNWFQRSALLVTLFLAVTGSAFPQTSSTSLQGTVTDPSGSAMASIRMSLAAQSRTAVTSRTPKPHVTTRCFCDSATEIRQVAPSRVHWRCAQVSTQHWALKGECTAARTVTSSGLRQPVHPADHSPPCADGSFLRPVSR